MRRSLALLLLIGCPAAPESPAEGEGDVVSGEGEFAGEGEGDVGEGEGEFAGEGEGDVVVVGEGEGDVVVGEGEGEGEVVVGPVPFAVFGFGKDAVGGWQDGHDDVVVTAFDDDGPGTLRDAIRTGNAPRVITFASDGVIALQAPLLLPSNLSIDGRGVTVALSGKGIVLGGADDVIVTHLTIENVAPKSEDGFQMGGVGDPATRVVLDHLTFRQDGSGGSSKNVDEAISMVFGSHDVTIQHCRIENWEKAMLFGNGDVGADVDGIITATVHHTAFINTGRRHPQARFGVFDFANNLMSDWRFFDSPFADPFPESFGAQIQDNGRLRFENNVVTRQTHTFDDAPFVSQAHDVTRCESGGVLDEDGTFVAGDNGDDALAFGVGCAAGSVVDRPYALDVEAADEALKARLDVESGNR